MVESLVQVLGPVGVAVIVWRWAQVARRRAVVAAEKRGYDNGWDACELMYKRKRQAAGQQAAATRKRGRDVT